MHFSSETKDSYLLFGGIENLLTTIQKKVSFSRKSVVFFYL